MQVGAQNILELPLLAKSALRLSYAPMAGKPRLPAMSPTSMEPSPSHTDISMDISMESNRRGGGEEEENALIIASYHKSAFL